MADLTSVPRATHELWHDLKMALISRSGLANTCAKSSIETHQDEEKRRNEKMRIDLGIQKPNYENPK